MHDTIGQFHPGGVGGANATQGDFEAKSRVNPWDFVLMVEGTLLLAGSVARRLAVDAVARAVFPFTVDSVAVGYGSATSSEETSDGSRAELWLPLWDRPATLAEVSHLFAEGRAQLGRRQARNSIEFTLAANLLGVSRGVIAFVRYGFLKRNGLAFLATPLDRVLVTTRPICRLLDDPPLATWLERLRTACRDKDKTPARYQTVLRQVDRAMYRFTVRSDSGVAADRRAFIDVIRALGQAEQALSCSLKFCEQKFLRPLQGLSPQWLDQADDGSSEFRLAMSLAGIRRQGELGPCRLFLEPVDQEGSIFDWPKDKNECAVWSNRPLAGNLAAIFRRRLLESFRQSQCGVPLFSARPAPLADVIAFLHGETDDNKIAELLWGLSVVDWPSVGLRLPDTNDVVVPFEFGVARLLVEPRSITAAGGRWELSASDEPNARPDPDVFHVLAAGQPGAVSQCVNRAALRLKSGGLSVHGYRNSRLSGRPIDVVSKIPSDRLLSAMLFPLSNRDLEAVANAVLYPPKLED